MSFVTALHQRFTILPNEPSYQGGSQVGLEEEVDVLGLLHIPHFYSIELFLCLQLDLTAASKDRAPFGSICPGSRTCVAPLSGSACAGS